MPETSAQFTQERRSRLRLPRNLVRAPAPARDFLTMYSGMALSRATSSQFILELRFDAQEPRSRQGRLHNVVSSLFLRPSPSPSSHSPSFSPPLLAGPAPIPMAGREMYAPEGLSARSGLPARLSPPAPAKRNNPPERGVIEDKEGGYRGCRVYVLNDSRASKSVQS